MRVNKTSKEKINKEKKNIFFNKKINLISFRKLQKNKKKTWISTNKEQPF